MPLQSLVVRGADYLTRAPLENAQAPWIAVMIPTGSYDGGMEAPGITRHRRPFLAPLWLVLLTAVVAVGLAWLAYRSATTTVVFLVRPPEVAPGTIADPPVSPEGEARAQRLAHMFSGARGPGAVDALYVSDDLGTQQTAAPLAEQLHHAPVAFRPTEARSVAARALREHAGETVVIIASRTAFAQILRELSGTDLPPAPTDENDVIYVLSIPTFGHLHLARFRL
jgi:broad specificity phosphatase PhoE